MSAPETGPLAEVAPLGNVPSITSAVVAANLQTILRLPALVVGSRPPPSAALLASRKQHDASVFLAALAEDLDEGRLRVGVTTLDLCLPMLTYVYGEARVGGRVAVVSTARLMVDDAGERVDRELMFERLTKVAVHEAAHALGLVHCGEPRCLMVFSVGLETLDRLRLSFCPSCMRALAIKRLELLDRWR